MQLLLSLILLLPWSVYSRSLLKSEVNPYYVNFATTQNGASNQELEGFVNFKYENSKYALDFKTSVDGFFTSYEDYTFGLPVLSVQKSYGSHRFSAGRDLIRLKSFLDRDWQLGVQTAYIRTNPFNLREQGRVGFNYNYYDKSVYVDINVSPISIPDQGASFDFSPSGEIMSNNPWAILPAGSVTLNEDSLLDLNYFVQNDSIPDFIFEPQFSGTLGVESDTVSIYGMYSNTPAKQLGYEADAKLQTDEPGQIDVEFSPIYRREHFFGLQTILNLGSGLSIKNGFYGLVYDDKDDSLPYQSENADYFFSANSIHKAYKNFNLAMYYLYVQNKLNREEGVTYIKNKRFMYGTSFKTAIEDIRFKRFRANFFTAYVFDDALGQMGFNLGYTLKKNLNIYGGVNLMHDFDENKEERAQVADYAALDSIITGIRYEF